MICGNCGMEFDENEIDEWVCPDYPDAEVCLVECPFCGHLNEIKPSSLM